MIRNASCAITFVAIFGMLGGCASDFVRPEAGSTKLGLSKPDEVTKLVKGTPVRKNATVHSEKIDVVVYNTFGSPAFYGTVIPHRSLTYSFFNDVLVGEELNSNHDGESTEFDIQKVSQLQKGQTKDQVIAIMGQPSGQVLYPLIADKAGTGFVYAYSYARFAPVVSPSWSYLLIITFNDKGVVSSMSYKENGKEVIAENP